MKEYDFMVVGQGLAGATLAFELLGRGFEVVAFDSESTEASYKVAAGIFNPITGRKISKTWLADALFLKTKQFYPRLELVLGAEFYREMNVLKPYFTHQEGNELSLRLGQTDYSAFVSGLHILGADMPYLNSALGAYEITGAGWVDTASYTSALCRYLKGKITFVDEPCAYEGIKFSHEYIDYKGFKSKSVIFCEGALSSRNPFFDWVPFNLAKGELLTVEIPGFPEDRIVNKGIFVLPLGNKAFRVGATYSWHQLDGKPTDSARVDLEQKLQKMIQGSFRTLDHVAGVRPATINRRPFIGRHPHLTNFYIFNGFGSKGVTLIPYFAERFADWLSNGTPFEQEADISQHYELAKE